MTPASSLVKTPITEIVKEKIMNKTKKDEVKEEENVYNNKNLKFSSFGFH